MAVEGELAEETQEDFFVQEGPGLFSSSPASPKTPDEPLALYRRYRPEVFAEIIGQDHITEPLKRALTHNRVNHAYLFSGPRGCGKTSSARILARSLNCAEGPTPTPCGTCQSCRDLTRNGPGSLDVIEIDAASHGGVDDARDLRERAFFAPVHSRYKVYIVDEAHQVTTQGFNALLKLVEEPPPHVKFIFATTEPDKVIGTIRSRTHHYPFRLIPPKTMTAFLAKICEEEHMQVEPGVIPMVVRAGAGSVRDSLSVLDQLFGGADGNRVGYTQAAALLGYTPDSLLDNVVDAIVTQDSPALFTGLDKVIETGHDPRRFTEDLLTRLRDLVIVAAVGDAFSSGIIDVAGDQAERYREQVSKTSVGTLVRSAEVLAAGLVGMRGATAPRLHLELMCARILLPGADAGDRGLHARLERLERQIESLGSLPARQPSPPEPSQDARRGRADSVAGEQAQRPAPPESQGPASVPPPKAQPPRSESPPPTPGAESVSPRSPERDQGPRSAPAAPAAPAVTIPPGSPLSIDLIRQAWPGVLKRVADSGRTVWMLLNQFASLTELNQSTLWVTFSDKAPREAFNRKDGEDLLAAAIKAELGASVLVRARLESEPIPPDGRTAILSLATPPVSKSPPPPAVPPTPRDLSESDLLAPANPVLPPDPVVPADPVVPVEPAPAQGVKPPPKRRAKKPDPVDAPSEDDIVVDDPIDEAAELVMELFDAELVKEEPTKPAPRARNAK